MTRRRPSGNRGPAGARAKPAARPAPGRAPRRPGILFLVLFPALLLALVLQTDRALDILRASRILRAVEVLTAGAVAAGRAPRNLLPANLAALERASALDPAKVGVPVARGTQYLLLRSPDAAIAAYREALALEPRPEVYLNLGRAQLQAGRVPEARASFATAVRLDPNLARYVPEAAR